MEANARFERDPSSVAGARRFVAEVLAAHERADAVVPLTLVVSELASNAVLHAQTAFEVDVVVDRDRLEVGVTDTGPGAPEPRRVAVDAVDGRGLAIVEAVCTTWGCERRGPAKRVWCALDGSRWEAAATSATAAGRSAR